MSTLCTILDMPDGAFCNHHQREDLGECWLSPPGEWHSLEELMAMSSEAFLEARVWERPHWTLNTWQTMYTSYLACCHHNLTPNRNGWEDYHTLHFNWVHFLLCSSLHYVIKIMPYLHIFVEFDLQLTAAKLSWTVSHLSPVCLHESSTLFTSAYYCSPCALFIRLWESTLHEIRRPWRYSAIGSILVTY